MSEVSRNVQQASQFLDELITETDLDAIEKDLPLSYYPIKRYWMMLTSYIRDKINSPIISGINILKI